jgi:hypothetical protein
MFFYCLFTSETFWVAIGSIGTVLAVSIAVRQIMLSRLTASADLLLRLEDRFDDEGFLECRAAAAKAIKNTTKANKGDIEDVFDFFETIGILVRKRALDKELVWSSFFYWLHGYYLFGKKFLDEQRKNFPARYDEFVWLHNKLLKIEHSKRPSPESEWDMFLDEEAGLIPSPGKIKKRPHVSD